MSWKSPVPLLAVTVLLLVSAWLVAENRLWSGLGNLTVPWFCAALALALVLVMLVCGLRGQRPSELPWLVAIGTVLTVPGLLLVGIEVDAVSGYGGVTPADLETTRWELLGFAVLLLGLFVVARCPRSGGPSGSPK